jgi:ABC-type iron transport system FetAB ATPase subunit
MDVLDTTKTETLDLTESKPDMLDNFNSATCSAEMLAQIDIPPRKPIFATWFREGDLGYIFGPRGLGKTWLAMHYAELCAAAGWGVLYVDGEMALDDIRKMDAALSKSPTGKKFYLHHEVLFQRAGIVLNLTDPAAQKALLEKCLQDGIKVLILDNLSCLFTGMKENDANAWEQVLPWLLELRRKGIAVVFIAHAGRNGQMRGTSRREDAAFWIIELSEVKNPTEVQTGARFVTRFVKNRNATEKECPPMEWMFDLPAGETRATVTSKALSIMDDFRQCIEIGLTGATEIAEELGISTGQVSKLARTGIKAGWLKKVGREYALTQNI